jgi:hypothetical protein
MKQCEYQRKTVTAFATLSAMIQSGHEKKLQTRVVELADRLVGAVAALLLTV